MNHKAGFIPSPEYRFPMTGQAVCVISTGIFTYDILSSLVTRDNRYEKLSDNSRDYNNIE